MTAHGDVYDVTGFIHKHPAGSKLTHFTQKNDLVAFASNRLFVGPKVILRQSGSDQSESFDFHSKKARKLWKE